MARHLEKAWIPRLIFAWAILGISPFLQTTQAKNQLCIGELLAFSQPGTSRENEPPHLAELQRHIEPALADFVDRFISHVKNIRLAREELLRLAEDPMAYQPQGLSAADVLSTREILSLVRAQIHERFSAQIIPFSRYFSARLEEAARLLDTQAATAHDRIRSQKEIPQTKLVPVCTPIHRIIAMPDNESVAIGLSNGQIQIRELSEGRLLREFHEQTSPITALSLHPHGSLIASGASDGSIRVWNWKTGAVQNQFARDSQKKDGHSRAVTGLFFAPPDGLISGSHDGTIRGWNLDLNTSGILAKTSSIYSFGLSSKLSRYLIEGHSEVRILSATPHQPENRRVELTRGGDIGIVSIPEAGAPKIAAVRGFKLQEITLNTEGIHEEDFSGPKLDASWANTISYNSLFDLLLTAEPHGRIMIWDRNKHTHLLSFQPFSQGAYAVTTTPKLDRLLAGGLDQTLAIISLPNDLLPASRLRPSGALP